MFHSGTLKIKEFLIEIIKDEQIFNCNIGICWVFRVWYWKGKLKCSNLENWYVR
jgi:hypothetical protein